MTGRSQAVRLPREFRFDTDRVAIRRLGRNVILSPLFEDWQDYLQNATRPTDDFEAASVEMMRGELPLEDREPFDSKFGRFEQRGWTSSHITSSELLK